MKNKAELLSERLLNFAANIINLVIKLSKTAVGRRIGGQLMDSATSAGANYEEARGAESKADFIHKIQVVLKELRESLYWLRLVKKARLLSEEFLSPLLQEAEEPSNIIGKSVLTAKRNR